MADTNHLLGELFHHLGVCKDSADRDEFVRLSKKQIPTALDNEARHASEKPPVWEDLKSFGITPEEVAAWGKGRLPENWRALLLNMHTVLRKRGVSPVAPALGQKRPGDADVPSGQPATFDELARALPSVDERVLEGSPYTTKTLTTMTAVRAPAVIRESLGDPLELWFRWNPMMGVEGFRAFAICMDTAFLRFKEEEITKLLLFAGVEGGGSWAVWWARAGIDGQADASACPSLQWQVRIVKQLFGCAMVLEAANAPPTTPEMIVRWMRFATRLLVFEDGESLAQVVRECTQPPFAQAFTLEHLAKYADGTLVPPNDRGLLDAIRHALLLILNRRLQTGDWPP